MPSFRFLLTTPSPFFPRKGNIRRNQLHAKARGAQAPPNRGYAPNLASPKLWEEGGEGRGGRGRSKGGKGTGQPPQTFWPRTIPCHNITYSFNNNCQTAAVGLHENKTINRLSNVSMAWCWFCTSVTMLKRFCLYL